MDVEVALALADELLLAKSNRPMNDLQRLLFRGAWQGKSFSEIHQECRDRCGLDHLMRNVGPELWQRLSEALGTRVSKNNLQGPLERFYQNRETAQWPPDPKGATTPEVSSRPLPRTGPIYLERQPYEAAGCQEILKPGALIRIKAPQEMGKSWLMERLLSHARTQGYQTQTFSFELSDSTVFTDLVRFSQWFCASVGQTLKLPNRLSEYWQEIFACNYNSTLYFENYLLAALDAPLVLALDKVDLVFEHPAIAHDFCSLLRGWNQRATQGDEIGSRWQQLRLIIVHSTEVYGSLQINHSPLSNIGLVLQLPEFTPAEVLELAEQYHLDWTATQVAALMAMVGGHPALIQQALMAIQSQNLELREFLQQAPTEAGPYGDHLRRHLGHLQQQPDLAIALGTVIGAATPVKLSAMLAFKLERMGLVRLAGDEVTPRCDLYRQYFRDRLGVQP